MCTLALPSLWTLVIIFLMLQLYNLVHDREMTVSPWLSGLLFLWEVSNLLLSLEVLLEDATSALVNVEFFVDDVILEGLLFERDPLTVILGSLWNIPFLYTG